MPVYRSSRHPFEIFALVACAMSGTSLLLGGVVPGSINALLPLPAVIAWGIALAFGSAAALTGIVLKNRLLGLLLEQVGLVAVGGAACLYAATILLYTGGAGLAASLVVGAFGVSCLWRWVQIHRLIKLAQHIGEKE